MFQCLYGISGKNIKVGDFVYSRHGKLTVKRKVKNKCPECTKFCRIKICFYVRKSECCNTILNDIDMPVGVIVSPSTINNQYWVQIRGFNLA